MINNPLFYAVIFGFLLEFHTAASDEQDISPISYPNTPRGSFDFSFEPSSIKALFTSDIFKPDIAINLAAIGWFENQEDLQLAESMLKDYLYLPGGYFKKFATYEGQVSEEDEKERYRYWRGLFLILNSDKLRGCLTVFRKDISKSLEGFLNTYSKPASDFFSHLLHCNSYEECYQNIYKNSFEKEKEVDLMLRKNLFLARAILTQWKTNDAKPDLKFVVENFPKLFFIFSLEDKNKSFIFLKQVIKFIKKVSRSLGRLEEQGYYNLVTNFSSCFAAEHWKNLKDPSALDYMLVRDFSCSEKIDLFKLLFRNLLNSKKIDRFQLGTINLFSDIDSLDFGGRFLIYLRILKPRLRAFFKETSNMKDIVEIANFICKFYIINREEVPFEFVKIFTDISAPGFVAAKINDFLDSYRLVSDRVWSGSKDFFEERLDSCLIILDVQKVSVELLEIQEDREDISDASIENFAMLEAYLAEGKAVESIANYPQLFEALELAMYFCLLKQKDIPQKTEFVKNLAQSIDNNLALNRHKLKGKNLFLQRGLELFGKNSQELYFIWGFVKEDLENKKNMLERKRTRKIYRPKIIKLIGAILSEIEKRLETRNNDPSAKTMQLIEDGLMQLRIEENNPSAKTQFPGY